MKWGGAAVTVLLLVVWLGSAWWMMLWSSPTCEVRASGGLLHLWTGPRGHTMPGYFSVLSIGSFPSSPGWFSWCRFVVDRSSRSFGLDFPLWIPIVVWLVPTARAWRLDTLARRRARLNLCPKCNYDRTGLAPGAVCPECGQLPA